jgi:hypothetical protein
MIVAIIIHVLPRLSHSGGVETDAFLSVVLFAHNNPPNLS